VLLTQIPHSVHMAPDGFVSVSESPRADCQCRVLLRPPCDLRLVAREAFGARLSVGELAASEDQMSAGGHGQARSTGLFGSSSSSENRVRVGWLHSHHWM